MVGFAHLFRPTYAGANVGHPSSSFAYQVRAEARTYSDFFRSLRSLH
jgi:hypothetical protein